jgi:hypothetical protein
MKSVTRTYVQSAGIYGDWLNLGLFSTPRYSSVAPTTGIKTIYTLSRTGNLDYTIGFNTVTNQFIAFTDAKVKTFATAYALRSYMYFLESVGYTRSNFNQANFDLYVK